MRAPGYNYLKWGGYVLLLGGLISAAFGWLSVLAAMPPAGVIIYSLQALLALFTFVESSKGKNNPARARNCAIDAGCIIALSIIVMIQTQVGFAWYMLPTLIGAVLVGIGAIMNLKARK